MVFLLHALHVSSIYSISIHTVSDITLWLFINRNQLEIHYLTKYQLFIYLLKSLAIRKYCLLLTLFCLDLITNFTMVAALRNKNNILFWHFRVLLRSTTLISRRDPLFATESTNGFSTSEARRTHYNDSIEALRYRRRVWALLRNKNLSLLENIHVIQCAYNILLKFVFLIIDITLIIFILLLRDKIKEQLWESIASSTVWLKTTAWLNFSIF